LNAVYMREALSCCVSPDEWPAFDWLEGILI
jgi:hypothetical protein